jgi:hypothetical protein
VGNSDGAAELESSETLGFSTQRKWLAALDDFRNWLIREAA